MPPTSVYEHGPVHRPVQGPARGQHGQARPVPAAGRLRCVLAGRPDACRLQRIYGTVWETQEELDRFLWRREEAKEARPPAAGHPARPLLVPRLSPGFGLLASEGPDLCTSTLRNAMRELQDRRGYQEIYTPPLVHQKLWEQSGHWEHYRRATCSWSMPRTPTFSLKPMNCPESPFIYRSKRALVPGAAAAAGRVRGAAPERAVGRALGTDARAALRHRRRAHLRATRPDRLGDRGAPGRDPRGLRAGSASSRR